MSLLVEVTLLSSYAVNALGGVITEVSQEFRLRYPPHSGTR